jgi:hypothetical protein
MELYLLAESGRKLSTVEYVYVLLVDRERRQLRRPMDPSWACPNQWYNARNISSLAMLTHAHTNTGCP